MSQNIETKVVQKPQDPILLETTQVQQQEVSKELLKMRERLIRIEASFLYNKAELGERIVMHPLFYDYVQMKLKTEGAKEKVCFNSNGWVGFNHARCMVTNSFSIQMLDGFEHEVHIHAIPEDILPDRAVMHSFVGNPDIAAVLGVACHRGNLQLRKGDILFVAQLIGGRLPQGCTKLPEGLQIRWYYVTID